MQRVPDISQRADSLGGLSDEVQGPCVQAPPSQGPPSTHGGTPHPEYVAASGIGSAMTFDEDASIGPEPILFTRNFGGLPNPGGTQDPHVGSWTSLHAWNDASWLMLARFRLMSCPPVTARGSLFIAGLKEGDRQQVWRPALRI